MNKKIGLFGIGFTLVFLFSTSQVYSTETIKIATLNWEPYIGKTLPSEGFLAEITKQAFGRSGYDVEFIYLPWKRAVIMAENGEYDAYFPAYWSMQREKKSLFTDSIISGPVGFFKLKENNISFKNLENLKPYKIGVVRGFVNTPEFDSADYLIKQEVTSNLQNMKKLLNKRVHLIVADKFVGKYLLQKHMPEMTGRMEFLSPPLEEKQLYICISKKAENAHEKIEAFNKGLKELRKDGRFNKILMKHGF